MGRHLYFFVHAIVWNAVAGTGSWETEAAAGEYPGSSRPSMAEKLSQLHGRHQSFRDSQIAARAGHALGEAVEGASSRRRAHRRVVLPNATFSRSHISSSPSHVWRCCPPDYFLTSSQGVSKASIIFVRPSKTGGTTVERVLGRIAGQRSMALAASPLDVESSMPYCLTGHAPLRAVEAAGLLTPRAPAPRPILVTILRDPIARAVACFYWAHRSPGFPRGKARYWRQEDNFRSFSDVHRAHAAAFAKQENMESLCSPRHRCYASAYALEPQFLSFGDTPDAAATALRRGGFLVGFLDRFDEFLAMLRRRLGAPSPFSVAYVAVNQFKAPSWQDWDPRVLAVLNASRPVSLDQHFMQLVSRQYREQVASFGSSRLHREAWALKALMDELWATCESAGAGSSIGTRSDYRPACVQSPCEFEAGLWACMEAQWQDRLGPKQEKKHRPLHLHKEKKGH